MKNKPHLIKIPVYFSQDSINKINSFSSKLKSSNFSLAVNYLVKENLNTLNNLDKFAEHLKDDILSELKISNLNNQLPFLKDTKLLSFENKSLSNELQILKDKNKILEQELAVEKEKYTFLSQKISSLFDEINTNEVAK